MAVKALKPDQLYRRCPPSALTFETTARLSEPDGYLGQERAVEALRFGVRMRREGYHMFVLGPTGTGRHSLVNRLLSEEAKGRDAPSDWVYVNNFEQAHKPRALELPRGRGEALRRDMEELVTELRSAIPAAFESEEYRTQRQSVDEEYKERQEGAFQAIQQEAEDKQLAVIRTPMGFTVAPVRQGEVLSPEAFQQMDETEQKQVKTDIEGLQERLQAVVQQFPEWERERRGRIRELDREVTRFAAASIIQRLKGRYSDLPAVAEYLEAVEKDVEEHTDVFMPAETEASAEAAVAAVQADARRGAALRRYTANCIVTGHDGDGAPVVTEDSPTLANLVGRVEHMPQLGALVTDFTLIKAGALHRSNGGFLVLDALRVLLQPMAWEGLKRALRSRRIVIESLGEMLSAVSTVSVEPEPVPLDVKVVLVGDRRLYYLLCQRDPDFPDLFKVNVDFEEDVDRTSRNVRDFARLLGSLARQEDSRPLARAAVARVVEESSRLSGNAGKLSVRVGHIADLVREADFCAGERGAATIAAADVQAAIDAKTRRSDRIRERMREGILEDTVLIDTQGEQVGQINGLAVLQLGGFAFGRPSRITALARLGHGEVIDIERRVELGGPLHSKGVLILAAFLGARFAQTHPLSLSASLVFEQSYSGVDGDSASSTELYALLSALSGLPIRQGLAVTGSVNQHGQVQAIGGVNEKIEGFFDVCAARGLTGEQGVLIPRSNVKHLMLRSDVVEAVREGHFHVYPVTTIDQGIELLTGRRAGARTRTGGWPKDTVNRLVQDRLLELAHTRTRFGREKKNDNDNARSPENQR